MTCRGGYAAAGAALAVAALAAGCGGSGSGSGSAAKGQTVKVRLTEEGCDPASARIAAGSVTFSVENAGTSKVTELELLEPDGSILGEAENVVLGIPGSFSLKLEPGSYRLSCPNGSAPHERGRRRTDERRVAAE